MFFFFFFFHDWGALFGYLFKNVDGGVRTEKMVVKGYKLAVRRWITFGDLMYNTVILVNNTTLHTSKLLSESEVAQSCLTLCDPVDCSSPGSSVHGVLQASKLEWVAISFSRGSSWPRDWTQVSRIADRRFNLWAPRG